MSRKTEKVLNELFWMAMDGGWCYQTPARIIGRAAIWMGTDKDRATTDPVHNFPPKMCKNIEFYLLNLESPL